jgi:hypothetical protein
VVRGVPGRAGVARYFPRVGGSEASVRSKRYDQDAVLTKRRFGVDPLPRIEAEYGLVVEESAGHFCGMAAAGCSRSATPSCSRGGG